MQLFDATMIAEGCLELVDDEIIAKYEDDEQQMVIDAYQLLIDTGTAWSLQGFFGRNAAALIEQGYCTR